MLRFPAIPKWCLRGRAKLAVRDSGDGQTYFVLVAANGEPMFAGETYTRPASTFRAAERLKELVAEAEIVDERKRKAPG